MDARRFKYRIGIIISAVLLAAGCVTTDLPSVNEHGFLLLKDEAHLLNRSKEAIAFFERSGQLYEEKELDDYLNGVYQKLLPKELKAEHLKTRIKVINQPQTNAFALSNGQLYISTSMLTLMDSEAQLAAVIGHEMTHVLERHALKVKRSTANKAAFFQSVSIIGPLAAFGAVSSISGYSRAIEKEADVGGMQVMADQGYDLNEAAVVYENLLQFNRDEDIQETFFFSTHPALTNRKKSAEAFVKEQKMTYDNVTHQDIFKAKTKRVTRHTIESWFQGGMYLAAEREIEQYMADFTDDAYGYYLKGELYRQRQDHAVKGEKRSKVDDYPIALKAYDDALDLDERLALAHRGRGVLLQKLAKTREAKEAYQRYLELMPQAKDYKFIQAFVEEAP